MTALSRKQWLIVLGALIVAFYIAFGVIERSLPEGTPGVIQYEFVGSEDRATEMLAEWGDAGQDDIRLSLWIDYGFMLVYGAFFTLAGARDPRLREGARKAGAGLGGPLGPWCAVGAALFDALENANLLLILGGHGGSVSPPLATACASVKFLLIAIAIVYRALGAGHPIPGATHLTNFPTFEPVTARTKATRNSGQPVKPPSQPCVQRVAARVVRLWDAQIQGARSAACP